MIVGNPRSGAITLLVSVVPTRLAVAAAGWGTRRVLGAGVGAAGIDGAAWAAERR